MAELTVQATSRSGLAASYAAAAGSGDEFDNDGKTFLHVKNGLVNVIVTLDLQQAVDGQDPASKTVTVLASTEQLIGPFPPSIYNDLDGHMNVAYDDVSNVTVAAIRLA